MADASIPRTRALQHLPHNRGDVWVGTRADLIAAGVIDETTPLPGDPGQRKTRVAFPESSRIHAIMQTSYWREQGCYRVAMRPTTAQYADAQLAAQRARSDAIRSRWPANAAEFRRRNLGPALEMLQRIESICAGIYAGGWLLDDDAQAEVRCAAGMLRAAIENGRVVFDDQVRQVNAAKLLVDHAAADPQFSALLGKLGARTASRQYGPGAMDGD